jgi:hypothetical protein
LVKTPVYKCLKYRLYYATVGFDTAAAANPRRLGRALSCDHRAESIHAVNHKEVHMKKGILLTLVLAVCGMLHNSVLAQENRYLVTYVRSSVAAGIRSATVVTVVNQSTSSCDVQVAWLVSPNPDCTSSLTNLEPGAVAQFCSRSLPGSLTACDMICNNPPLASQTQGKAIVSSEVGCDRIAVDARVYYTMGGAGPSPANDTTISAISNPKIVFFGEGNLGD